MVITDEVLGWNVRHYRLIEKADHNARNTHLGATAVTTLLGELEDDLNTLIASNPFAIQQSRE
jgi:hypothetical protein